MEDCPRVGWTGVELRHLEALRAVAEEMSFRGAARRLGFGQSAISQQIALLERRVGARLVDRPRGGKTVGLTPTGALLLRHAEVILDRVALAERELVLAAHGDAALRIGVFQSVGASLLPPSLALAQRARAGLQVQLVDGSPRDLLRLVSCGELDMAFGEETPGEPELRAHALLDDPYVLLGPAGDDSIPTCGPVTLEQLAGLPLLTYDTSFHARLEPVLAEAGVRPDPGVHTDDAPTLHGLVAAGVGYALVPRLAANAADDRIVAYAVDEKLPHRSICLVWHRDRRLTESMKTLLAAAKRVAEELREPVAA